MRKRIPLFLICFFIKVFQNRIYFIKIPISLEKTLIEESNNLNIKKKSRIWKPNISLFSLKNSKKKKNIIPIKFNYLKGFFEEENEQNIFGENLIDIENFDCDCTFTKINIPQISNENLKNENILESENKNNLENINNSENDNNLNNGNNEEKKEINLVKEKTKKKFEFKKYTNF